MAAKPKRFDVAVVGDDVPAMVAALECARYGFRVAVIPSDVQPELPSLFANDSDTLTTLCVELGLDFEITDVPARELNIAGVPGNPFARNVVAHLGWAGAWRVYLDRLMPLLSIGNEENFQRLVTKRIGARAFTQLVKPALERAFGPTDSSLRVDEVAHGLSQAVSRVGSLTGGVLELIASQPGWVQRVRIVGGSQRLAEALRAKLDFFAVRFIDGTQSDQLDARVWIDDVACSPTQPSMSRQLPRARNAAASARAVLLSDPAKPPVGPIDLER